MAEKVTVKAERREKRGKNDTGRLRRAGKVPMVVYGGGSEPVSVAANLSDVAAILRSETGHNTVFSLDVDGVGASDVIFQDRQIDPLKGRLMHADLRRLVKGEKIEMTVPVQVVGEAEGVRTEGGVLNLMLHEIKVLCEPANTPEHIDVDVTNLRVGESIHVSEVKFPENVEVHELPDTVIATITVVRDEELEPQMGTGAEPEVIDAKGGDDE